jgi:UDP-glucose 4-epimerase
LRFFNVFGPRQDPRSPYSGVIALFIAAMLENKPVIIHGDGMQSRDFVYVADAAQALIKAAEAPAAAGNVYNIGSGHATTILDLVRELNAILGATVVSTHSPARAADVRQSLANIDLARHDLQYRPSVTFADGLRATIAWYRATHG